MSDNVMRIKLQFIDKDGNTVSEFILGDKGELTIENESLTKDEPDTFGWTHYKAIGRKITITELYKTT